MDDHDEIEDEYLVRANDLIHQAGPPHPDLIQNFLPDRKLILLSAQPKMAKSLLVHDIAEAVATGDPWLGRFEVCQPGPVALYALEDGKAEVAARLRKRGMSEDKASDIFVRDSLDLSTAEAVQAMATNVRPYRPRLVIVDTAAEALHIRSWNNPVEVRNKLRPILQFAHRRCTVLMIVHNNKRNQVAGSVQVQGAVDGIITITDKIDLPGGGLRQWLELSGRGEMRGSLVVDMDADTKRFALAGDDASAPPPLTRLQAEKLMAERLDRYLAVARVILRLDGLATTPQIAQATGLHERTARNAVRDMRERGMVVDSGMREGPKRNVIVYRLTPEMEAWTRERGATGEVDYREVASLFRPWDDQTDEIE